MVLRRELFGSDMSRVPPLQVLRLELLLDGRLLLAKLYSYLLGGIRFLYLLDALLIRALPGAALLIIALEEAALYLSEYLLNRCLLTSYLPSHFLVYSPLT